MSDMWLNIRIARWHIQAKRGSLWAWQITRNDYWWGRWKKDPIAFYQVDFITGWRARNEGVSVNVATNQKSP